MCPDYSLSIIIMTTDKIRFTERRAAMDVAVTRLRSIVTDLQTVLKCVAAEANAMREAELRFAKRSDKRKQRHHG
jgi:hypothetical protein